ncbi:DUF924 family protein [Paraglaciecola psychrophila]|uniref:DUF924 domain-containing protein n=1 Tax=Paraglaciecola psychrophila 170 TaxID=1129794 RepID=K6ZQB9_9ALTE|nr:DUF924 family protein [Paraglaciecola psychrophila]AGH45481.1 hypothetical protein C427_3372 [Paraglaciecola psychrophila 170]GAC38146.1 hypothetical protein GPSY_2532 [Paraglaciecola psychrophila 170]
MTSQDIITFWFEKIESCKWWSKDHYFDDLIKKRFSDIHRAAKCCELSDWRKTAQGRLAEIIVLDQFSRNMFRNSALSFTADPLALALAQEAISVGADAELNQGQRSFLFMPFMHSESLIIHGAAVKLYTDNGSQYSLDFEIKHRIIIAEFGRYPHRNSILSRTSTQVELEFLTQDNSSF